MLWYQIKCWVINFKILTTYGHVWFMVEKSLKRSNIMRTNGWKLVRTKRQASSFTSNNQGLKPLAFLNSLTWTIMLLAGCRTVPLKLSKTFSRLTAFRRQLWNTNQDWLRLRQAKFVNLKTTASCEGYIM